MDKKIVFVKTDKGESEVRGQSDELYGDVKRILHLVDDVSNVGDISKRSPPSLRETIQDVLQELVDGDYIRDQSAVASQSKKSTLKITSPAYKMATPKAMSGSSSKLNVASSDIPTLENKADLDFSFIKNGSSQAESKMNRDNAQSDANVKAKQEAERLKAEQAAQIEATARAAKLKAYAEAKERAKSEVAAKAAKLKSDEEAKAKAKFEADAKARIEEEARLKKAAETARIQAEQEAIKARAELEATKARVEAETRVRIEAEVKIKQEAEAARIKAEKEAEKIRQELAAAKAKSEQELKTRLEAEARARAEEEARKKREAESELLRIEKERAELEIARIKAETELKLREEAERRVKAEVEARLKSGTEERLKQEAETERLRIEKERAETELARVKAEAEMKMRADAEIRIRAEVEARLKAEEFAKHSDRRWQGSDKGLTSASEETEAVDAAEKLRQSFVESFGQSKVKPKSGPLNFRLDTFSFDAPAVPSETIVPPPITVVPPSGGSKVKALVEKRAQQEAEARRIKAEQDAAKLAAEQAAAVRKAAEQEEVARIRAEQEQAARIKLEQEAHQLLIEQEERAKADAEEQELTDQQAKQWEQAQQRAASQAQSEKERLTKEAAESKLKFKKKTTRHPRKSWPTGKIVASLFVLALLAVVGLPYIWLMDDYIVPLEKELAEQAKQPVHIKTINFALLPLPKLVLHGFSVGNGNELKAEDAIFNFDLSALFSTTKSINSIELNNVIFTGSSLDKILLWLQATGKNEKYPVARIDLRRVEVKSDAIKLPLLNGRVNFDSRGELSKAHLASEDEKLMLEIQSLQNHLQLELNIRQSSLPILTDIKFNDLSVNGVIENGSITLSDFFAHTYGGTLTGNGQLGWKDGWILQGQLNAKSIELKNLFPNFGVTGQLYGDVIVSMSGVTLSQLDDAPRLEGSFEAKNGVISKLDIDTIARFGARQGVAGHTDFSEIIGTLKADKQGQRIYLSKISAGAANGSGLVEVDAKQQLSGRLSVEISGLNAGSVPLRLSGTPAEPSLQQSR